MMRSILRWSGVAFFGLQLVGCGAGVLPQITSEAQRLEVARGFIERGRCVPAVELLKTYIANNPGGADVDQAIYLLGLCNLRTKDWVGASVEFERLLRDYPESDSAGSAAFRLGEALFGQARPADFDQEYTKRALAQWNRYLQLYPGHWLNAEGRHMVSVARHRLASKFANTGWLYLKLDLAGPARVYFEKIENDYADTTLLGDALLGLARCDEAEGLIDQAIERLTKLETEFAGRPIGERARAERRRLERRRR